MTPDIFCSWGAGFAKPFVNAGKVLPLDEYLNDVDSSKIIPFTAYILRSINDSSGFVLAWDTYLAGTEAQTNIDLVADLFSGRIDPEGFTKEMQKLNSK